MAPIEVCLIGDRADQSNSLRYPWLKKQHEKYGDDRWFNVSVIENFLLNEISNVYFCIHVKNDCPMLFHV